MCPPKTEGRFLKIDRKPKSERRKERNDPSQKPQKSHLKNFHASKPRRYNATTESRESGKTERRWREMEGWMESSPEATFKRVGDGLAETFFSWRLDEQARHGSVIITAVAVYRERSRSNWETFSCSTTSWLPFSPGPANRPVGTHAIHS